MMMGPQVVRYGATSSISLAAFVSWPHGAITGAQTDAPAGYAGDLWSRPRPSPATGGESRDWLAKRGVTLDHRFAQVLQGAATGRGRHGCGAYNVGLSINGTIAASQRTPSETSAGPGAQFGNAADFVPA